MIRICSKCQEEKDTANFRRDAKGRDGFSAQCKLCRNKTDAAWIKNNPAKVSANNTRWRKRHPEQMTAIREKWAKAHPGNIKIRKSKWRKAHPDRHTANENRRRAAQLSATPGWTNHVAVGEFYALAAIKTRLTGVAYAVDHIVPLRSALVCGLHTQDNLAVILDCENARKGNRVWPDMPEKEIRC